jgi:hypothetical protein
MATAERKLQNSFRNIKHFCLMNLLTSYPSRPPYLYGLPKIHTQNTPLGLVVSSIGSCYILTGFLRKVPVLTPLIGK